MDSRSVFPIKITSFEYLNIYPPMSLNTPSPFGDGLNYRGVNSSLSIEGASLKVRYFLFGSPVSASAGSKPIYEIKTTEY